MKIKCTNIKCNYEWDYNGKHKFYATCPRCLRKVSLLKKLPKSKNLKADIKIVLNNGSK